MSAASAASAASAGPVARSTALPDALTVDLPALAARLAGIADDLSLHGRVSRRRFRSVVWDDDARAALDAELDRLDADLDALVAEVRARADSVRLGATSRWPGGIP
ncbi:hypothetical protein MOPEL_135_01100 [Mobilicoccus pelagius NBRC 104925]|uniref:Uncharacterized protein n=1 Tax=Mobilicoccus pelagius NBRC 104925 TaxID=1089455 RepID=H5UVW4_9MICO|nr:hypothetical protein MOPEL_135_01100 [Mobilicoccus pelagius NBRC 104925]